MATSHPPLGASRGNSPLTAAELSRLTKASALFDIDFHEQESGNYLFKILDETGERVFEVSPGLAESRLIAELCSKTIRWVYYRPSEHCLVTLLDLTDKKINRIAQLYQKWKSNGFSE